MVSNLLLSFTEIICLIVLCSLIQVRLCQECIEWAKEEKRTFLRQSLEARLVALYFDTKKYQDSLRAGKSHFLCGL